jgi:hypothetical protein
VARRLLTAQVMQRHRVMCCSLAVLALAPCPAAAEDAARVERGASTPADGSWSLQLAAGVRAGRQQDEPIGTELSVLGSFRYALSDRLIWSVPTLAFAYRAGERGGIEVIPFGGLLSWGGGYSSVEGWIAQAELGGGAAVRIWRGTETSINLDASVRSRARWSQIEHDALHSRSGPTTWRAAVGAGLSHQVGRRLGLHGGVQASARLIADGEIPADSEQMNTWLSLGSVQQIGLRWLPLLELHLGRRSSLDAFASLDVQPATLTLSSRALLGFTVTW